MSPTRALITGGTGFVGRHVAKALATNGHDVVVTSRQRSAERDSAIRNIACDLLSNEAPATLAAIGADTLIHLAWETTHGAFWNAPVNLDWAAATLKLARAFREAGGRRFVGIGTCFEYDMTGLAPLGEQSAVLRPETLYGVAKDATRRVVQSYAEETGMEFAWVRLFHLYGPDETSTRLVPSVIAALLKGGEARTTAGTQLRNFMHAADAGRAIAAVALSDHLGPINVGAFENTTIADLARLIAAAVGRPDLLRIGAYPTRQGEPVSIVPKLDQLAALGFTPTFDLASGIADAIRSQNDKTIQDPKTSQDHKTSQDAKSGT